MLKRNCNRLGWALDQLSVLLIAYVAVVLVRSQGGPIVARSRTARVRVGQAPFYRSLLRRWAAGDRKALAVLTQPAEQAADYFRSKGRDQSSGDAATAASTVRLERAFPDEPVSVVRVLEGETDVTPRGRDPVTARPYKSWTGKPFQAGDDWLKNVVMVVKNLSNKEIVGGSLGVEIPQVGNEIPGSDKPYVVDVQETIYLGTVPEHALFARDGHKVDLPPAQPLHLVPGQEIRVSLAARYEEMRKTIEAKRSLSSVTTCWVRLHYFYFADGTRWAPFAGFQKPDLNAPGKYLHISPEEFGAVSRTSREN
jgi:hypothetical protein